MRGESGDVHEPLVRSFQGPARVLSRALVRTCDIQNVEVFTRCFAGPEPPNVVSLLNHGPAHSLAALLPVLIRLAHDEGLADERPGMILHRTVHWVPVLRRLARRLAGGEPVTSAAGAVTALRDGSISMFGTMPEGAACLFDFGEPIGPFEKNGLIAVGLAAGSTFVLCVHKGTESWARTVPLPPVVFRRVTARLVSGTGSARGVRVPYVTRRADLRVRFELHEPATSAEEFATLDRDQRRRAVRSEADRIRARVARIHDGL